jgi:hypothetical protein
MGVEGRAWAKSLADYSVIAEDWDSIAARAISGAAAPIERRDTDDILRYLGYGQARLWVRDALRQLRRPSGARATRTPADVESCDRDPLERP